MDSLVTGQSDISHAADVRSLRQGLQAGGRLGEGDPSTCSGDVARALSMNTMLQDYVKEGGC